ncbi:MAG: hypothetical protein U1F10_00475 [Burkholderiales bacterium]
MITKSAFEQAIDKLTDGRDIAGRLESIEYVYSAGGMLPLGDLAKRVPTSAVERGLMLGYLREMAAAFTLLADDIESSSWDEKKMKAIDEEREKAK